MIVMTTHTCPKDLIETAVDTFPLDGKRVALNRPTGHFFYDKWEIKPEFKETVWEEILNSLPYSVGEARVITLQPGETYMAHADIDNRYHLNLTGQQSYLIDLDTREMHQQRVDGSWRYMYADKIHTAANFGSIPRQQLVVRQLLNHSSYRDMISVKITTAYEQHDYRYKFDNIISPWLNKKNQERELDDFEYTENLASFKIAKHVKEELDELLSKEFTVTYD